MRRTVFEALVARHPEVVGRWWHQRLLRRVEPRVFDGLPGLCAGLSRLWWQERAADRDPLALLARPAPSLLQALREQELASTSPDRFPDPDEPLGPVDRRRLQLVYGTAEPRELRRAAAAVGACDPRELQIAQAFGMHVVGRLPARRWAALASILAESAPASWVVDLRPVPGIRGRPHRIVIGRERRRTWLFDANFGELESPEPARAATAWLALGESDGRASRMEAVVTMLAPRDDR